jgi:hypothetical protein
VADTTEFLLLRRVLGRARPEDYVDWAVHQLCRDVDSLSLRILAGLNVHFDRDEIESYFRRTCRDLGLTDVEAKPAPREIVRMIRRAHDQGQLRADDTIDMMADVYESSEYKEELLAPWYSMREELAWGEGYSYPPAALVTVERAINREWSLFDRAAKLDLPPGWLRRSRCEGCAHVGVSHVRGPSTLARVLAAVTGRQCWSRAVCEECGSDKLLSLSDPDARTAYFDELESSGN